MKKTGIYKVQYKKLCACTHADIKQYTDKAIINILLASHLLVQYKLMRAGHDYQIHNLLRSFNYLTVLFEFLNLDNAVFVEGVKRLQPFMYPSITNNMHN